MTPYISHLIVLILLIFKAQDVELELSAEM